MAYSTKKKRGRPKVHRTPHDYGNAHVQARADRFRMFGGESSKGFEMTCAGRLMLVGAFDGLEQEPAAYLSALLEYANAFWANYGGGAQIASYERQDRSHDTRWEDPRGERFNAMDARLRDAGHQTRSAVISISVDRHWFPDENAAWADRIINSAFLRKELPVAGELACDSDWAMLELLRSGVRALVEPARRMARAA